MKDIMKDQRKNSGGVLEPGSRPESSSCKFCVFGTLNSQAIDGSEGHRRVIRARCLDRKRKFTGKKEICGRHDIQDYGK